MIRSAPPLLLSIALAVASPSAQAQPREIEALNQLCRGALDRGDDLRAANLCKRVYEQVERLAPGTEAMLTSIRNLAELKRRQDNNLAADELYTEALRIVDDSGRGETLLAAELLERQADAKIARGTIFEAEPGLRRALAIREALDAPDSLSTAATRVRHGTVLGLLLQFQDAHVAYRRALTVYEHGGRDQRHAALATRQLIAELLTRQYRLSQAESEYRRLLEDAGSEPPVLEHLLPALDRLAWIAAESGRRDDAVALYRRELELLGDAPANASAVLRVQAEIATLSAAAAATAPP